MKKTVALLILVLAMLMSVGCGTDYKIVPATDLVAGMISAVGQSADYMNADADHYDFYFGDDPAFEMVEECQMVFSRAETDVNEFGIFRVDSADHVTYVKSMVELYLSGQVDYLTGFAENYSPADLTKLQNADVETLGNYVFYYILSEEDEAKIKTELEKMLK